MQHRSGFVLLLAAGVASCAGVPPSPPASSASFAVPMPSTPTPDVWAPPRLSAPVPISPAEYAARRAALAAAMRDDGVLIVLGSPEPETDYLPFSQNSPFRYLTGINEPGAALVVARTGDTLREQLFVRPRDPSRELWEGRRLGAEGAERRTGIPSRTADALLPTLDSLLARAPVVYTAGPAPAGPDPILSREQQIIARLASRHPDTRVVSLEGEQQRIRALKSEAELDRIRRAVYITVLAQRSAMRNMEPGLNEFEIQALIDGTFRRYGAERPSFASIVGSGPNSTTLHYNADDRFIEPGDLVVMDVGAAYDGYAADVTRTVPANGVFSPEQRAIYEIVLAAQKAAEAVARPGATRAETLAAANRVLAEGLARLGLIEAPDATYRCETGAGIGECPQLRLFFPHGLSHGIGLDVHDPDISDAAPFRVGSAFTIEPGLYIRADALSYLPNVPENRALAARLGPLVERYRDIGVRIEDDYFVTPTGVERISDGAPREIAEVEALMEQPGGPDARRPEIVEWYRTVQPKPTP